MVNILESWYVGLPEDILQGIATLNSQQKQALIDIVNWYLDGERGFYKLTGYAGSGKTYLLAIILKVLMFHQNLKVCAIAPSHKAKRQIKTATLNLGIKHLEYRSVSSFLGKSPVMDDDGNEHFQRTSTGECIEPFDLVACDEYGMVDKSESQSLLESSYRILFIGDSAQLPPVNETVSFIDEQSWIPESVLTQVVRYGGDLLAFADTYNIKKNLTPAPFSGSSLDGTIVHMQSKSKLIKAYADCVKETLDPKSDNYQNWSYARFISHTNKNCALVNDWVRELLYEGESSIPYLPGERLIALKPLFRQNDKGKFSTHTEGSMEFTVIKYIAINDIHVCGDDYKYHYVEAQPDEGRICKLMILHDDYIVLRSLKLQKARANKQWKVVGTLSKMFDNIAYGYAITCYKAQGSTYLNNFIDVSDLRKCSQMKQIFYTAITRTKDILFY